MAKLDYEVTIREVSAELSARDRIKLKDFGNAVQLDEACTDGSFLLTPAVWAILDVHNEKSSQDKDYHKYIIMDNAGNKFITGSDSFFKSFMEIWNEMKDSGEEYSIEVYRRPSKNYKGKFFLSCSLV